MPFQNVDSGGRGCWPQHEVSSRLTVLIASGPLPVVASAAWRRAWTVFCDAAISGGWDPGYGTRLVGDLEALDLADLQVEVIARLVRGDSVGARLFADSLLRLEERMLALGARDDDLAETQRLLRDPTVTFRAPSTTIGWGRRPD